MTSNQSSNQLVDSTNPIYIHPFDGPTSVVVEKLEVASNYRAWRRDMELSLAAKRKLGFVIGGVRKDISNVAKKEAWDTCNSMVITWILRNVSETIKKSVMFMNSVQQIWSQLEQRFLVTNGARKYSLDRQMYSTKQGGRVVFEYYTDLRVLWEELQALTIMPPLTEMNAEVASYVEALRCHQEEQRLFQFLNGLDEAFSHQRSQMLLMTKLPHVEEACKIIQQEESQREIFAPKVEENSRLAMNSRKNENSCSNRGKTGHSTEQC
ncbi:Protein translocase subunit SecA [Bienertia sinuspersici]